MKLSLFSRKFLTTNLIAILTFAGSAFAAQPASATRAIASATSAAPWAFAFDAGAAFTTSALATATAAPTAFAAEQPIANDLGVLATRKADGGFDSRAAVTAYVWKIGGAAFTARESIYNETFDVAWSRWDAAVPATALLGVGNARAPFAGYRAYPASGFAARDVLLREAREEYATADRAGKACRFSAAGAFAFAPASAFAGQGSARGA